MKKRSEEVSLRFCFVRTQLKENSIYLLVRYLIFSLLKTDQFLVKFVTTIPI